MIVNVIFLTAALGLVVLSADILVSGASSIARKHGISPFVIGLTVVAFGTSAPELAVNIFSSVRNEGSIAFGNIMGSNIFNILVILGLASVIHPLSTGKGTVRREIPIALASAIAVLILPFTAMGRGHVLMRIHGVIFLIAFSAFIILTFRKSENTSENMNVRIMPVLISVLYIIAGLIGLFFGGRFVVSNAVALAQLMHIDSRIISLTIIAAGTSLPELATSVVAALKKADDIAVGNIIGSNIFNILFILGISTVINPIALSPGMFTDAIVMALASLILFITMFTGKKHVIDRFEGIIMLILYAVYMAYIIIMRI